MAECMRIDIFADFGFSGIFFNHVPHGTFWNSVSPQGNKQVVVERAPDQFGPDIYDIVFQIPAGDPADGDDPVFSAFALHYSQAAILIVNILYGQVDDFRFSDTWTVKNFKDGYEYDKYETRYI